MKTKIFVLNTGLMLVFAQSFSQPADSLKFKIDSMARVYLSDTANAGMIIGIIRNGDTARRIFPFGVVKKGSGIRPDGRTIYKLGSIGKTFTATALAYYVVNYPDKAKLTDPVNKFFPGRPLPYWLSPQGDTVRITLANLAMHYSSLPRQPLNFVVPPKYTNEKLLSSLGNASLRPLNKEPGTQWLFSNYAFGVLGATLEKISGLSYEQLLETTFFNELKMFDTPVKPSLSQTARIATGYVNSAPVKTPWYTSPGFYGAGGNYSSMDDMMKFLSWNMGLTASKLNNLLDTLHQARDTTFNALSWQGLAWQINFLTPGKPMKYIWKNGETNGYASMIAFVPGTKTGVIILANNSGDDTPIGNIAIQLLRYMNFGVLKPHP